MIHYARDGRENNFHLIRHIAAAAVVLTHSYSVVTGRYESEPLVGWLGVSIGHYAVDVFFVLSGFLVTQSLARNGDLLRFAVSRALRIFPALIVAVLVSALVLGPLVSTLEPGDYFSSPELPTYILGAVSTAMTDAPLPGVFMSLPHQAGVNEPLWTLKYELAAYLSLAALAVLSLVAGRRILVPTAAAILAIYIAGRSQIPWPETESFVSNALHLLLPFYLGATAYVLRRYVPLRPLILVGLTALAVAAHETVARELTEKILITYAVLWLAFLPLSGRAALERLGDCSYGIYILAFPIQQTLRLLMPDIAPLELFGLAMITTVPLALISWHLIERPAMKARNHLVARLRSLGSILRSRLVAPGGPRA